MDSSYFRNNKYILALMWKIKKGRVIGEFFYRALRYIYWVFYDILFLKYLVEALDRGKRFDQIMGFILFSMLGFAIPSILSSWYLNVYKPKADTDIFEALHNLLFDKASRVELECYENADFYNRFTLAMKDCEQRITQIIENQCTILTSVLTRP